MDDNNDGDVVDDDDDDDDDGDDDVFSLDRKFIILFRVFISSMLLKNFIIN